MTSSYKPSAATLILIALLFFSASTPRPVHGQTTGGLSPITIIPSILNLLSNTTGGNNLLPQLNILSLITRILSSLRPVTLRVAGQVICPGQGTGVAGLPVNLTCVINGNQVFGGQTVTNRNGSFAVNGTVSALQAVGLISNLLPNNTLPCIASTSQQLVQSVVSCPAFTNTTNGLVSLVRFTETNVFSLLRRTLNANATGSFTA